MPVMPRRRVAEATISKDHEHHGSSNSTKNSRKMAAMTEVAAVSPHKSSSKRLDLQTIDDAFGKHSDLYEDVLQVAISANQEEIQLAYFDRRSELFTILAKIDAKPPSDVTLAQRFRAEKKMDAVVLAVRILGDPSLRASYDRIRPQRLQQTESLPPRQSSSYHQSSNNSPRLVTPTAGDDTSSDIYDTSAMGDDTMAQESIENNHNTSPTPALNLPPREKARKDSTKRHSFSSSSNKNHHLHRAAASSSPKLSKKQNRHPKEPTDSLDVMTSEEDMVVKEKQRRRVASSRKKEVVLEEPSLDLESRQEDDTLATVDTMSTHGLAVKKQSSGMFSCITGSRFFRKISDEISGACEDTLVSVDQVFNAFTLTDKDIKAVTKKIHKAKRQLDT